MKVPVINIFYPYIRYEPTEVVLENRVTRYLTAHITVETSYTLGCSSQRLVCLTWDAAR